LLIAMGRFDQAREDVTAARRQGLVVHEGFIDLLDEQSGSRE
jgi:hypothetical protein